MSRTSFLPVTAAALPYSAIPTWGQELPEGKGKEVVAASCNGCHPFYARVGAGYTADGWRTVMRTVQSWAIPGGGNIVRNTSVTQDGNFVLANSLGNAVTLVTIEK